MLTRRLLILPIIVPLSGTSPPPVALDPSSKWVLDYADEQCRLGRAYGTGNDQTIMQIQRFSPRGGADITISGKAVPVPKPPRRNTATVRVRPGGFATEVPAEVFESKSGQRLVRLRVPVEGGFGAAFAVPERANELEVRIGGRYARTFKLGKMTDALKGLDKCLDDLVGEWGLDAAAVRTQRCAPIPIGNVGGWVKSGDYPAEMLSTWNIGEVAFRLIIDSEGKPESCTVQQMIGNDAFKKAACENLLKRARFEPAIDAEGKPMRDAWLSRVRFSIP